MKRFTVLIGSLIGLLSAHTLNAETIERLGDIGEFALPATAATISLLTKDYAGLSHFSKSLALTVATVYSIKPILDEDRPKGGGWSFPSGHTAAAVVSSAYMLQNFGWKVGVPATLAAGFVGYSRVHAKKHWVIDVLAGGLIGIASNMYFSGAAEYVHIEPSIGDGAIGLTIELSFD